MPIHCQPTPPSRTYSDKTCFYCKNSFHAPLVPAAANLQEYVATSGAIVDRQPGQQAVPLMQNIRIERAAHTTGDDLSAQPHQQVTGKLAEIYVAAEHTGQIQRSAEDYAAHEVGAATTQYTLIGNPDDPTHVIIRPEARYDVAVLQVSTEGDSGLMTEEEAHLKCYLQDIYPHAQVTQADSLSWYCPRAYEACCGAESFASWFAAACQRLAASVVNLPREFCGLCTGCCGLRQQGHANLPRATSFQGQQTVAEVRNPMHRRRMLPMLPDRAETRTDDTGASRMSWDDRFDPSKPPQAGSRAAIAAWGHSVLASQPIPGAPVGSDFGETSFMQGAEDLYGETGAPRSQASYQSIGPRSNASGHYRDIPSFPMTRAAIYSTGAPGPDPDADETASVGQVYVDLGSQRSDPYVDLGSQGPGRYIVPADPNSNT